MAKILTDLEIIDIVARAPEEIDDADQYERFIAALAQVVTEQFGGALGTVEYVGPEFFTSPQNFKATSPKSAPTVSVAVHHDDCVPDDGGIWIGYDPDVDEEFRGESVEKNEADGTAQADATRGEEEDHERTNEPHQ